MSERSLEDVYGLVIMMGCAILSVQLLTTVLILMVVTDAVMLTKVIGPPTAIAVFSLGAAAVSDGYNRRFWRRLGADYDGYPGGEQHG